MTKEEFLKEVKFDEAGLIPVIAQDYHSKHVRMLAYMNKEALEKTLETGNVYYYSRSRKELWLKGDTSSYYQHLKGISINCEGNSLLMQIEQDGGISCHTGNKTCFYRELDNVKESEKKEKKSAQEGEMLKKLVEVIQERKINPKEGSYTNYLFNKGIDKILKKVGEEATETIIAAKGNQREEVVFEVADLIYHLSVMLVDMDLTWEEIALELGKRE